jgi:hypothetical protein
MFVYELEPEPKELFTALQHRQQASVITTLFWRGINSHLIRPEASHLHLELQSLES